MKIIPRLNSFFRQHFSGFFAKFQDSTIVMPEKYKLVQFCVEFINHIFKQRINFSRFWEAEQITFIILSVSNEQSGTIYHYVLVIMYIHINVTRFNSKPSTCTNNMGFQTTFLPSFTRNSKWVFRILFHPTMEEIDSQLFCFTLK